MPNREGPRIYGDGSTFNQMSSRTVFRGDDTKLILQPGSKLSKDETGLRTLRRRFMCRTDLVERFEPREGDIDFQHRALEYWTHEVTEDGPIATIDVSFSGVFDGDSLKDVVSYSSAPQEVAIAMSPGEGQGQLVAVYISPEVMTRYAARVCPGDGERIRNNPMGQCRIVTLKGQNGVELTNFLGSTQITATYGVYPRVIRSVFEREQRGSMWMVTERVQRVLTQVEAKIVI